MRSFAARARFYITPALRTPGGQYRWNLDAVKQEMDQLWKRDREE